MQSFQHIVADPQGVHARPAGLLAKQAQAFASTITIRCGDQVANAKKLYDLMRMGVKKGMTITVEVDGEDETAAASALQNFLTESAKKFAEN